MKKYIGFEIDNKKIVACVFESREKGIYLCLPRNNSSTENLQIMNKLFEKRINYAGWYNSLKLC
ncbi:hypothetical protein ACFLZ8_01855 [Planctomycetota bacterium]